MPRAVTLLIVGSIVGAGAMLVFGAMNGKGSAGSNSQSLLENVTDFALGRNEEESSEVLNASEILAVYRAVANDIDRASLRASLDKAASASPSVTRDVEIDALLARLVDLAPAEAVAQARGLEIETQFLADAYIRWAEVDPQSALSDLGAITDRAQRREVALALLDVFGDNNAGLARVSEGLPESDRELLRVEWLARRAEYDPLGAFRAAQSLNGAQLQSRAFQQIASAWAKQDPLGALSQANSLPSQLQSQYRMGIFQEWARQDGAAYLSWLESTVSPPQEAILGIELIAASRPEYVLRIADGMTGDIGMMMRRMAMTAIAEVDAEAAMARVANSPPGQDRNLALMSIGSVVARRDPDAALAWAQQLSPPSRDAMTQIAVVIAQVNPERALEFLDNPPAGMDPQLISSLMVLVMSRDPAQARTLADKLVVSDSFQSINALRSVIGNWMQQDPERALEWVLAHESQVNAGVLGNAAQTMARSDPIAASRFVDRIPAEYRSSWITQVAGPYAISDPAGALAWVAQFQGQEIYDSAMRQVVMGSAQNNPRSAAALLDQASGETQLAAASQVAQLWANQDPRASARWAETLSDPRARGNAIGATVMVWAASDPSAAERWTMDLDRGELRDQALHALVTRVSAAGDFDRSLLNAYSADSARQEALRRVIPNISRNDPEQAQELLGLVTNGNTRRQIERQIEEISALR